MNMVKKYIAFFILCTTIASYSCNVVQVKKKADNQKIYLDPNNLERLGDSVRFDLTVILPNAMLLRNETYALFPYFKYDNETYFFEKKLRVKGDTLDVYSSVKLTESYTMPFVNGMENGSLYAKGEVSNNQGVRQYETEEVLVSTGIITTASLSQIGQYRGQEQYPVLGLWIDPYQQETVGMLSKNNFKDLKDAFSSYSGMPFTAKAPFLKVLEGPGDWTYKLKKLKALPSFGKVQREVLNPFVQKAVRAPWDGEGISDLQLSILSRSIRKGQVPADTLSENDYIRAVDMEPGWNEKEEILRAMVEVYPSAFAFNNLGFVFANKANRTRNTKDKNQLLENALFAFNRSNAIFENPYAVYNLGIVFWLWEDKFSAYNSFYRAFTLTEFDEIKKVHQAALGAVSIFNGDYRLAVIHLNNAEKSPVNLFNQGLANVLSGDYYNATIQFENSAIQNMSNGFPFYGLAIIAARNGEETKLYENLKKAIIRNQFLRDRAAADYEFAAYHNKEGFKEVIR
ncbi:TPR end-of-group domain-containing protein [Cyclobacterium marinum]|uniref:TPR end-of-group domain-containing protein n=1 Tax=Cyclobacterium marinum TaxID=104 RepID=UPI0011EEC11B|nr:hypothetical protein [Cyclobacterium marinum]MBI0398904.1 hypothetical protein [Cyclobacterium marinum]